MLCHVRVSILRGNGHSSVFKLLTHDQAGLSCIVEIGGLWKWSEELRHEPEGLWSDTEVVEDDEVGVHTSGGLDDSDLEVGEGDELGVHEVIKFGLSWGTVHDI